MSITGKGRSPGEKKRDMPLRPDEDGRVVEPIPGELGEAGDDERSRFAAERGESLDRRAVRYRLGEEADLLSRHELVPGGEELGEDPEIGPLGRHGGEGVLPQGAYDDVNRGLARSREG